MYMLYCVHIYMYMQYLHAGEVLEPTGNLQGKVMHVLHVHDALGVDIIVSNRSHRVSEWDSSPGVLGRHLAVSTTRAAVPCSESRRGGKWEHKVVVAAARGEYGVLSGDQRLHGAEARRRESPGAQPVCM